MRENVRGGGGGVAHEIRVTVLGGFAVDLDGSPVPEAAWRRNRARAVVKLLALARRNRLHRDQLMDALWPTLDPQAAAGNLRKAIHYARGAIGAEHIRIQGEMVALDAPVLLVDVHAFEAANRAGQRAEALGLYGGELLPEDRFEPWTEDPRESLRKRFHDLLMEEAAALESDRRYDAAVNVLDRLVADDPLHEAAYRVLVRVLALAGDRHLALARYAQLVERLRDDLGVEPEPAIRRLVDEIASGRFPGEGPSARVVTGGDEERRLVVVLSVARPATDEPDVGPWDTEPWATHARAIAESWGGNVVDQSEDGLVVVFGFPTAREDDAPRALRAALEIVGGPRRARAGVATGDVITEVGGVGTARRITGHVIDQATSLCAVARPGTVLVAERTASSAGAGFRLSEPIAVERSGGRTTAMTVVAVDRPAEGGSPSEAPLVGRDAERAVLLRLVDEAMTSGQPRLIELGGPAGIGKSRLARELMGLLSERWPHAMILRGRCQSGGRGSTFGALGDILREACGIGTGDTADEAEERLRRWLATILGSIEPADVEPTISALAMTAGLSFTDNPLDQLPPSDVAERLGLAWPVFASACAAATPTVLLIEDAHWARPELLDIVEHVVRRSRGPLAIVVTARPELRELRPSFGTGGGETASIALPPLGQAHSETLADCLLEGDALDAATRADLLGRAEGNPFYLEQLIHHLRLGVSTELPDTLQSLLAARLDALPMGERRVLQEASVAGRVFWEEPIREAIEDERTGARLAALERKGFVVRRTESTLLGQAEYAIRHALLHDVAYASLPPSRRARGHAAIGAWLEGRVGDRVDEVVDLLAHHYWAAWSANLPELAPFDGMDRRLVRTKAFEFSLRAGDAARRRFIIDRAVELHERALAVANEPGERLTALEALARDREDEFHGDAAASFYEEALAIARTHRDLSADRSRLCRRLAWMMAWNPGGFRVNPDAEVAERLVDEGMAFASDDMERAWLSLVRGCCARLYRGSEPLGQGRHVDPRPIEDRIAAAEHALAFARDHGADELGVAAGQALGMLQGLAGNYEAMIELAANQVAKLRPEDSRLDQSDALRKLAIHLINVRADFGQGLELGRRSRRLLGAAGATGPHQVMHALWPILVSLFQLGRWDEIGEPLEEHVEAFREEPAIECQAVRDGPIIGAAALTLQGRPGEALSLANLLGDPLADRDSASAWQARLANLMGQPEVARAISEDKSLEGRVFGPQHAFALLEALSALGDWDAVRAFLPAARRTTVGNAMLAPMADRAAGLASLAEADPANATRLLRRAARGFRRLDVPFEEARTLVALAQALPTDAETPLARALDIYARLGAEPAVATIRDAELVLPSAHRK